MHGIEILEEYKVTRYKQPFLMHNLSVQDDKRIIICKIYGNICHLSTSTTLLLI